jgi:aspartyl protease family protein
LAIRNLFSMMFAAVAIALVIAFVFAPKFQQQTSAQTPVIVASATPQAAPEAGPRSAFIEREDDGHYWTRADVGGTQVEFMVDTGASIVALTYFDAQRLGLSPEDLDFDAEIRTAGGVTYGASVTLDSIRVGKVEIENIDAVILRSGLDQSLLGMTFLGQLDSYEVRRGQMIIRQ